MTDDESSSGSMRPMTWRRTFRTLARTVGVVASSALLLSAAAPARPQSGDGYAIVVHPSTAVTSLSLSQVRRIFLGEQQFWPSGGRVVLFVQAPGTPARAAVLRRVYQMDEPAFKRYWIEKTFRDEVASGPKIVSTQALARRLTATIPGAVSVIPASEVDGSVKVLRVDGRAPGDDGYVLAGPTAGSTAGVPGGETP